ncbi:hypothetical protein HDV01_003688 [Terramyces sp. JEL0728]|nr:hypothetical protein HDV01_003688 [Terramyces sp. JEL0728]
MEHSDDELPAYFEAPTKVLICKHPETPNQLQVLDLNTKAVLYTVKLPAKDPEWKLELYGGDGSSSYPEVVVYREKSLFLPDHTVISHVDNYSTKLTNKFSSKYSFQSADGATFAWKGSLADSPGRKLVSYPDKKELASYKRRTNFVLLKLHPSLNSLVSVVIATFLTANEWENIDRFWYRIPKEQQWRIFNRGRSRQSISVDSRQSIDETRRERVNSQIAG